MLVFELVAYSSSTQEPLKSEPREIRHEIPVALETFDLAESASNQPNLEQCLSHPRSFIEFRLHGDGFSRSRTYQCGLIGLSRFSFPLRQ